MAGQSRRIEFTGSQGEQAPDVKHFDPSAVVGTVTQLLWQRGWAHSRALRQRPAVRNGQ
jgi:hypothetical protein